MGHSNERYALDLVTKPKLTQQSVPHHRPPYVYLKSSLYGSLLAVLVLKANSNSVSSLEGIISARALN